MFHYTHRRCLLKTTGLTLTLPMLESGGTQAETTSVATSIDTSAPAKRLICVGANLGLYRPAFYPTEKGRDYKASELLAEIDRHRDDYTVFSGFDHRAGNGHKKWDNYLCGRHVGDVSLDQIVAESAGANNRFKSLQLSTGDPGVQRMVYNRRGVPLPMTNRPSEVYRKLFASADDRKRTEYLLTSGRSSLDQVRDETRQLRTRLSMGDRKKLDEYFSSLRELETRMARQLEHLAQPAAKVDYELPPYDPVAPTMMLECEQIMFDLMALALQTDSTRVATLFIAGLGQVFTLDGQTLRAGYHALSHHGNDPDLIRDLVRVEREHMRCLGRFLDQLNTKTDSDGRPLLDTTIVMFGTGMGDASRHSNKDLPTLIAGGGFRHGNHVAADPSSDDGGLLGRVYLDLLHQLGIPAERFSDATSRLREWS